MISVFWRGRRIISHRYCANPTAALDVSGGGGSVQLKRPNPTVTSTLTDCINYLRYLSKRKALTGNPAPAKSPSHCRLKISSNFTPNERIRVFRELLWTWCIKCYAITYNSPVKSRPYGTIPMHLSISSLLFFGPLVLHFQRHKQ